MWDTWVFQDGDQYHLFFLSEGSVGRAVSKDLIHWKRLPPIKNLAKQGDWDESGMMCTGCTVKHEGKYYMSYGSGEGTPISFLISTDLANWKRIADDPVLPCKAPYRLNDHWRDLSAYFDEDQQLWHGYLFGIHDKTGRDCLAHLTSQDYTHWTYHEPIYISQAHTRENDGFNGLEVPDYFQIGDKHYLLFCSVFSWKDQTSGRKDAAGTWYLMADERDGPYRVPERPLLLGYGRGRRDTHVGRTLSFQNRRLLYHHTWGANKVCWGTLKLVHQNADGTLTLRYWQDLNKLQKKTLLDNHSETVEAKPGQTRMQWIEVEVGDAMITFDLDVSDCKSAGLSWRRAGPAAGTDETGAGVVLDREEDTVSIAKVDHRFVLGANTVLTHLMDDFLQQGVAQGTKHVRILTREHMADIYVDDQWIFSSDMKDLPTKGKLGFFVESGKATISNLHVAEVEPLR